MYLSSEKLLSSGDAQEIRSFYFFMLGEGSAAAAAEQLVAEEAQAAAKAAAKKAKKQKARARKQQARSEATSPTEPAAAASLQARQALDPSATLHQLALSETKRTESTPDQDHAGQQVQLQHDTVQDSAVHTPVSTALHDCSDSREGASSPDHEQKATVQQPQLHHRNPHESTGYTCAVDTAKAELVSSPAAAGHDMHAVSAALVDASRGADAIFLDQLFCCPITKVAMVDPVIASDGHTYERTAIQHWLQGSSLSPVTGDKLPHTRLVPNVLVKSALAQHTQVS
ncbi:hypothetical protein ABBQ38_011880 [Trebouxia sp. C0009 RCD-2024]